MDIAHIEPFIDATVGMFREMLGMEPEYLTPYILPKDSNHGFDISGIIGIAGDSKGVVVISFNSELARFITSQLVGKEIGDDDPYIVDAVGELVNIVAGNAKKGLEEYRLNISLPSIVKGFDHRVAWPTETPIVGIPFKLPQGRFHLSVGLENIITA